MEVKPEKWNSEKLHRQALACVEASLILDDSFGDGNGLCTNKAAQDLVNRAVSLAFNLHAQDGNGLLIKDLLTEGLDRRRNQLQKDVSWK